MNWHELEKMHIRQWEDFQRLKQAAWELVQRNKKAVQASFGILKFRISDAARASIRKEHEDWRNDWGAGGEKEKELKEIQKMQREEFQAFVKLNFKERLAKSRDRDNDRER